MTAAYISLFLKAFIRFQFLRCQNLSLLINVQNLKLIKQLNQRPLFDDLSNESIFFVYFYIFLYLLIDLDFDTLTTEI